MKEGRHSILHCILHREMEWSSNSYLNQLKSRGVTLINIDDYLTASSA